MSDFPVKHNTSILLSGYSSVVEYEFFENFHSNHTKLAYRRDLVQFFNFIKTNFGPIANPNDIQKTHVLAFRNALSASNCPKTVIRKLAAISTYCAFMIEKGFMSTNPTVHIKRPKDQVITETNDLSDSQVTELINSVDISKPSGLLHKAILVLLFSTGIRKGELINLRHENYQEQKGIKLLQYQGKGGKIVRTPLHPVAVYHLEAYLSHKMVESEGFEPGLVLFSGCSNRSKLDHNKKLQPTSVDYIVKKYASVIGVKENITPHSARATLIGSLLQGGCDLYKISQLVNHSNVKTTQGYDKRKKSLIESPVFKLTYL